jgi:DNA mismatch endonuclease (patch repair protein)
MGITRSENMSRIRSKNTSPELVLGTALTERGIEFTSQTATKAGHPDIVLDEPKVAIFIDGCFWHGCPDHYVRPRSKIEFWAAKLTENLLRDRSQTLTLENSGWKVLRVWEHEVFTELEEILEKLERLADDYELRREPSWRLSSVEPLDETGSIERRCMVDLRDETWVRVVEQQRHTKKW